MFKHILQCNQFYKLDLLDKSMSDRGITAAQINHLMEQNIGLASYHGERNYVIPEKNFFILEHFVRDILNCDYAIWSRPGQKITGKHRHVRRAHSFCTLCPYELVSALHTGGVNGAATFYGISNDIILVQPGISVNDVEKYITPLVKDLKVESAALLEEEKIGTLASKSKDVNETISHLKSVADPKVEFNRNWFNSTNFSTEGHSGKKFLMCSEHIDELEDKITPAIKNMAIEDLKRWGVTLDPKDIVITYETEKIFDSNPE